MFFFSKMFRQALQSIQLPGFFPGVEQWGHEVNHSPPCSTKIMNDSNCTSASWCGQGKLYLLLSKNSCFVPCVSSSCILFLQVAYFL